VSEYHNRMDRPRQYRIKCDDCGSETSENLRMHSQVPQSFARRRLSDAEERGADFVNGTPVQCNNCDTVRVVGV